MARERRNDAWLAVALALGLGAVGYLLTDTINWSRGFGYDGLAYGTLAMHFPSGLGGTGVVVPGGIGNPLASGPHGLDGYNALRWLPSGLAYLLMLGSSRTVADVMRAFSALNVLCLAVIAWAWIKTAEQLHLTRHLGWLGVLALLMTFNTRTAFYAPVYTDMVALALGSLAVYFWVDDRPLGVFLVSLLAAFTWPEQVAMGAVMLIWPFGRGGSEARRVNWRAGGIAALVTLGAVMVDRRAGGVGVGPWHPSDGMVFVGGLLCAAFAGMVVASLAREGWRWFAPQRSGRLALAALLPVIMLAVRCLIAVRSGQSDVRLFGNALIDSTRLPALFLVSAAAFYGPLFLVGMLAWPRVARTACKHGPGLTIALGLAALFLLFGQPRTDLSFYPVIVVALALAFRGLTVRGWQAVVFAATSFLAARLWMPIGTLPASIAPSAFTSAPAQRWDMSSGAYTAPHSYAIQLIAEAVVVVSALVALRIRAARHIAVAFKVGATE